jgi:hypothetical protein
MDVQKHAFTMRHDGKILNAILSIFQPKHTPLMYRVFLDIGKKGSVFILYPDQERKNFKHYPMYGKEGKLLPKIIKKIQSLKL